MASWDSAGSAALMDIVPEDFIFHAGVPFNANMHERDDIDKETLALDQALMYSGHGHGHGQGFHSAHGLYSQQYSHNQSQQPSVMMSMSLPSTSSTTPSGTQSSFFPTMSSTLGVGAGSAGSTSRYISDERQLQAPAPTQRHVKRKWLEMEIDLLASLSEIQNADAQVSSTLLPSVFTALESAPSLGLAPGQGQGPLTFGMIPTAVATPPPPPPVIANNTSLAAAAAMVLVSVGDLRLPTVQVLGQGALIAASTSSTTARSGAGSGGGLLETSQELFDYGSSATSHCHSSYPESQTVESFAHSVGSVSAPMLNVGLFSVAGASASASASVGGFGVNSLGVHANYQSWNGSHDAALLDAFYRDEESEVLSMFPLLQATEIAYLNESMSTLE